MAYTTIDDPSAYFHTRLYTGNGASSHSITNNANSGNFKPDWLWIKQRSQGPRAHSLWDTSRGNSERLQSDNAFGEETQSGDQKTFDTNGFTVGGGAITNENNQTHVAWQWKANGGTTSSNTDGSITSTVQADTTAGFSIVSYTGVNTSTGQTSTIGHGLNSAPELIICKRRNGAYGWSVGSTAIGNFTSSNVFELNETGAPSTSWADEWGANPTSTVFTTGYSNRTNISGGTFIAYCFAPIQGYSKIGSYTGNGNADGPFIYTGFKPSWVIIKHIGASEVWRIFDSARDTHNAMEKDLFPNLNNAEGSGTARLDFLSNGFKIRDSGNALNDSGGNLIYMAFAESPFVSSKGVPTTAR